MREQPQARPSVSTVGELCVRPLPGAASARQVIIAGLQPRPQLKGYSRHCTVTLTPPDLTAPLHPGQVTLRVLPWGVLLPPPAPKVMMPLLFHYTQGAGVQGLLSLAGLFKGFPLFSLPLTLTYPALSAMQRD